MARLNRVNHYRRYQGSSYQRPRNSGPSYVLRIIAIILFILLLLLAIAMLFLQDYVVYSDRGIRLDLPWLVEETPPPSPLNSSPIITDQPSVSPSS